jgi:hypothetical protein
VLVVSATGIPTTRQGGRGKNSNRQKTGRFSGGWCAL